MPKILSEKQIAEYEENGLVFPVTVMSENDAKLSMRKLETYEAEVEAPFKKSGAIRYTSFSHGQMRS